MKLIITSWLLFVLHASAATWYVSPSGSGAKNGTTYANSWSNLLSVVWGSGGVTNGDTLYICGTHIFTMTSGSFSGGKISLVSGVTLRGDYPGDSGMVLCNALWQMDGENNWQGPDANGVYWNNTIYDVTHTKWYELPFQVEGTTVTRLNYKTNTTWVGDLGSYSFIGNTNFVKTTGGTIPNGNLATTAYGWYFDITGLSNVTFQGMTVIGPIFQTQSHQNASNVTFINCTFSDECITYLMTGNDFWMFNGCDISHASAAGIYAYDTSVLGVTGARNLVVTNCYIHDIGFGRYVGNDGHGIGVRMFAENYTITHNRIVGTASAIVFFGDNQTNNIICYNNIKDTHATDTGQLGGGIKLEGAGYKIGCKIYGNVLVNMATNSSAATDGVGIQGAGDYNYTEIYNNTISNANFGIQLSGSSIPSNGKVVNNIVINPRLHFLESIGTGTTNTLLIDYNLYWTNGYALATPFHLSPEITHDAHSVYQDPLIDVNFHLIVSSPAINAGTNAGLPYCQSAPDMGAFEFCNQMLLNTINARNIRISP